MIDIFTHNSTVVLQANFASYIARNGFIHVAEEQELMQS